MGRYSVGELHVRRERDFNLPKLAPLKYSIFNFHDHFCVKFLEEIRG